VLKPIKDGYGNILVSLHEKSMLWPENPGLISCMEEIDGMLLEVLPSGVLAAEKSISSSFTESKEDRRGEGGVLMSAVS
jgi:hypothetical protein